MEKCSVSSWQQMRGPVQGLPLNNHMTFPKSHSHPSLALGFLAKKTKQKKKKSNLTLVQSEILLISHL